MTRETVEDLQRVRAVLEADVTRLDGEVRLHEAAADAARHDRDRHARRIGWIGAVLGDSDEHWARRHARPAPAAPG